MNYPLIVLIVGGLWAAMWSLSERISIWPVSDDKAGPTKRKRP